MLYKCTLIYHWSIYLHLYYIFIIVLVYYQESLSGEVIFQGLPRFPYPELFGSFMDPRVFWCHYRIESKVFLWHDSLKCSYFSVLVENLSRNILLLTMIAEYLIFDNYFLDNVCRVTIVDTTLKNRWIISSDALV